MTSRYHHQVGCQHHQLCGLIHFSNSVGHGNLTDLSSFQITGSHLQEINYQEQNPLGETFSCNYSDQWPTLIFNLTISKLEPRTKAWAENVVRRIDSMRDLRFMMMMTGKKPKSHAAALFANLLLWWRWKISKKMVILIILCFLFSQIIFYKSSCVRSGKTPTMARWDWGFNALICFFVPFLCCCGCWWYSNGLGENNKNTTERHLGALHIIHL